MAEMGLQIDLFVASGWDVSCIWAAPWRGALVLYASYTPFFIAPVIPPPSARAGAPWENLVIKPGRAKWAGLSRDAVSEPGMNAAFAQWRAPSLWL
jgi:hypothetical protein